MEGEETTGVTEQAQPTDETPREVRFEMRVDPKWVEHIRRVANLAATIGIIREDRRGNMAAWVNYCMNLGEGWLKQQAKARGDI